VHMCNVGRYVSALNLLASSKNLHASTDKLRGFVSRSCTSLKLRYVLSTDRTTVLKSIFGVRTSPRLNKIHPSGLYNKAPQAYSAAVSSMVFSTYLLCGNKFVAEKLQ
jgi:hypothetical protein